ncbi:MAG: HEAT repeat domain-containing protein [Candidatus Bipolaricaulota bacterium]|nr:HEAT repeat domain-containing protein [Candidatus Bipolaricaulota bacterium]MDW8110647.1 HEAT repeat domain-containing protein [Candidatus Bipolaricaulota bacterium]
MTEREWWRVIFGSPLGQFNYNGHPHEEVLRAYIAGALPRDTQFSPATLEDGQVTNRAEVTAHLLTCAQCAQRVARWRIESAPRSRWQRLPERWSWQTLRQEWQPVPRLARLVMAAQFAIIIGLSGLLYFKPAPLFSTAPHLENPLATTISPPKEQNTPPSPSPQPSPQTITHAPANDLESLIAQLRDAQSSNRLRAVQLLGESNDPRAIAALSEALYADDERLRAAARAALQQIQERLFAQAAQLNHLLWVAQLGTAEERSPEAMRFFERPGLFSFTVRVSFREDTPAREIETLVRKFNGLLTYTGRDEFILQLPSGFNLNDVMRELSAHPQIKTVRR